MLGAKLAERDRRALRYAVVAVAVFVFLHFLVLPGWDALQAARTELPVKQQTLAKFQRVVDSADTYARDAQSMSERLKQAESGLLAAATEPLAAAELQNWLVSTAAGAGIEVRSTDFQKTVAGEEGYRQVPVGLQLQCRMEQLVNFLSAIQSSDKVVSISRFVVSPAGGSQKQLTVTMTVSGWMKSAAAAN